MKTHYLVLSAVLMVFTAQIRAQDMKFEGTHPPSREVLKLIERETEIFENEKDVGKRDSLRSELLSPAWFYFGQDAKPVNLEGLTKRQTRNEFESLESKIISETLYQYESTAILVVIEWGKGKDRGKIFEGYESYLIVMGIENGEWKIQADIQGREPELRE